MIAEALPDNQTKIAELESIRGLAALLVVFVHIPKWHPMLNIGIINNGYLMVELFFVLSGFVIFNAYASKIESKNDLIRFQFLRFGRLYPVHVTFLLLFLGIEIATYVAKEKLGAQDIRATSFDEKHVGALIEQLLLLQAIGPTGNAGTFNGAAWSISVEFYTYFVFGLTILFFRRIKGRIFSVVTLISLCLLATKTTNGFEDLLRCLAGFFIGCLTASYIKSSKINLPSYLSTVFFTSIIIFLQLKNTKDFDIVIYFLSAALITSLMLSPKGLLNILLRHKMLTWLGVISYSVYMSHVFVIWMVSNALKRLIKFPEKQGLDGNWMLSLSTLEASMAVLFIVILVVAVSQITYAVVEKPFRERSRRLAFSRIKHVNHSINS